MSELPDSWATTKLGELAEDISYGYTAPSTQEKIGPHLLRITDIQNNNVCWSSVPFCEIDQEQVEKYLLKENDLVFARTGATVGKSFLITGKIPDSVFASYLIRVRSLLPDAAKYLAHYFQSHGYWQQITEFSAGIGQPNVNGSKLKELNIPIPPIDEQTRIAQKLDELLAQVDTLKARIDAIPALLKRFRQSVLAAAVSGRLTEEWRARNKPKENLSKDKGWKMVSVGQASANEKYSLAIGPFGSNLKVSDYKDKGKPLVFVREIRAEAFGDSKTKFINKDKFDELYAHRILGGDILITKMGDPPGDVAIYPTNAPEAVITADCIKLRVNDSIILRKFAYFQIKSENFRQKINDISAGVAQQKVSLGNFRELPLLAPPIDEQTEIVRRVEQLFAFADQLEAKVATAQARIDRLTQSILAKAFRGELVPQDPNDEPAGVLLERIRAQRAAEPKSKRGRKSA